MTLLVLVECSQCEVVDGVEHVEQSNQQQHHQILFTILELEQVFLEEVEGTLLLGPDNEAHRPAGRLLADRAAVLGDPLRYDGLGGTLAL